jgi:hypothetical protein
MRIFLSHASEQRADAERLAIALRAREHTVFLDADDLPAGGDYLTRIEQAIAGCELFCFLISPQSVAPNRYTLSELSIARRRWPNPTGHVLPIMLAKVPIGDVPPYLRAVSIFQPAGDLVADVLPCVEALRPKSPWPSRTLRVAGAAAVIVVASIAGYFVMRSRSAAVAPPSTAPSGPVETPGPESATRFQIPALDKMNRTLSRFVVYMKQVGFTRSDDNVTVHLYSKESPLPDDLRDQSDTINAFYYKQAIYVHFSMSADMSVLLREYSHHVLIEAASNGPIGASAIESALADYFPSSFLGSPLIGEGLGPLFKLRTSYIRRLDNPLVYSDVEDEPHARGEVWAGALWACRQDLGQAVVDGVPATAWLAAAHATRNVEAAFGKALLGPAGAARACLSREMEKRKIPREI